MNVRIGLIRKKPDWTREAFLQYWRATHGPLAARMPNLREYWQNVVTERMRHILSVPPGPWEFDGFSQLWFDDVQQASSAVKDSEFARALIADEQHFLGTLHIVTAIQHVVVTVPGDAGRAALWKRMSIVKRRPDITEDDFRSEWKMHEELIRKLPGVRAYRRNVVISRERIKGQPCDYGDLPIDGIVELWFDDAAAMQAGFASPAGQAATTHAKEFLAEITTFAVVERRVV
jgi:uncharacterized protein (TIGR02118 family)